MNGEKYVFVYNFSRRRVDSGAVRRIAAGSANLLRLSGDMEVIFVGRDRMRGLNRRYRNKDSSATALVFPYKRRSRKNREAVRQTEDRLLGQIFISPADMEKEQKFLGISRDEELTRILAHAIVHIAGYAHKKNRDRRRMEKVESKILKGLAQRDANILMHTNDTNKNGTLRVVRIETSMKSKFV